jgi:Zn-dependent protease with chaperone function
MIRSADQQYGAIIGAALRRGAVLSADESPESATTIARVRRIANEIVDAAGARGALAWDVTVIKDSQCNAFVLPNGKIVVLTGILPIAGDDAGLAAVLGHEVGHVVGRHTAERASQALLAQLAVLVVDVGVALADPRYRGLARTVTVLGTTFGLRLPFSRLHEAEADRLGMIFMAKAGYDPAAAIALWERMERAGGSRGVEFFSTHPSPSTRIADLRRWLPESQRALAQRAPRGAPATVALGAGVGAPPPVEASAAPGATPREQSTPEPPAAAPTLEAKLAEVDGMWQRGVITDEERVILRRRVVEAVGMAPAVPVTAMAPTPRPSSSQPWIVGHWVGQHHGSLLSFDRTEITFRSEDGQIRWHMNRRTQVRSWVGTLRAAGVVRFIDETTAGLEGAYYPTSEGGVGGKPLEYTLALKGDWIDGVGVGAVDLLRVTLRGWR